MTRHRLTLAIASLMFVATTAARADRTHTSDLVRESSGLNPFAVKVDPPGPADRPAPRSDRNSAVAHEQLLEKARTGRIDVYFVGDSITRRWGATDYPDLLATGARASTAGTPATSAGARTRTENILWRLENGELDGVNPKVIVDPGRHQQHRVGARRHGEGRGHHARPRGDCRRLPAKGAERDDRAHGNLSPQRQHGGHAGDRRCQRQSCAAGGWTWREVPQRQRQARRQGRASARGHDARRRQAASDAAGLPGVGDGLRPILLELLGPPAATDQAPPPTGNPGVREDRPKQ